MPWDIVSHLGWYLIDDQFPEKLCKIGCIIIGNVVADKLTQFGVKSDSLMHGDNQVRVPYKVSTGQALEERRKNVPYFMIIRNKLDMSLHVGNHSGAPVTTQFRLPIAIRKYHRLTLCCWRLLIIHLCAAIEWLLVVYL